jgi:hypothetical protein
MFVVPLVDAPKNVRNAVNEHHKYINGGLRLPYLLYKTRPCSMFEWWNRDASGASEAPLRKHD